MKKELGEKRVIAEDLGFLTPSVIKLVQKTGFPGMKNIGAPNGIASRRIAFLPAVLPFIYV